MFGKDYFDELLEKIREIRASERRFYQKVTDIYAQCSIDYDPKAPISQRFYAHVQDKLHYAVHHHTSAELIELRADASKPNMGLTHWENEGSGGKGPLERMVSTGQQENEMISPSLETAVIAGLAGISPIGVIARPPVIEPYYRIDGSGCYSRHKRHKQRGARDFDAAKRKARNKSAKAARARNRK